MSGVRMDKWLWAARFYKTRPLAVKNCELGRVEANGQRAKPAREVHVGDTLQIRTEGGEFTVEVLALDDVRGPASVAQTLYRESAESQERRKAVAAAARSTAELGGGLESRPSKGERAVWERMRGRR